MMYGWYGPMGSGFGDAHCGENGKWREEKIFLAKIMWRKWREEAGSQIGFDFPPKKQRGEKLLKFAWIEDRRDGVASPSFIYHCSLLAGNGSCTCEDDDD
jgi:hypothetical protein